MSAKVQPIADQRLRRVIIAFLMAVIADQVSKWLIVAVVMQPPRIIGILPFFNLRLGYNTGISFGMFADQIEGYASAFALFKLVIVAGLILWALRSSEAIEQWGLSLIAGGAAGNILDRYRQGGVTDFLDFFWNGWHYPTFNLADVAITLGAGLMLLAAFRPRRSTV